MNKTGIIIALISIIFIFSGCNSTKAFLDTKIKSDDIDKIQIVLSMGNPKYGADSKIITDKDEIKKIVDAFNNAAIGKQVKDEDVQVAAAATYYFYNGSSLIHQFSFNGNDTERIWLDSKCYYIKYADSSPYKLYQESKAKEIVVDENLTEIERPQE